MEDSKYNHLVKRINDLEQHLVNLHQPMQQIASIFKDSQIIGHLLQSLEKPLKVDDRRLLESLDKFFTQIKNLDKLSDKFDLVQTLSEIKYIGNRLAEIEKNITTIVREGVRKNVCVEINLDGQELEPKVERVIVEVPKKKKPGRPKLRK